MKKIIKSLFTIILFCISGITNSQVISTFEDSRDGKTYKTVQFGNLVWFAENYAYKPDSGSYWIYNDEQDYLKPCGYLYDWETAINNLPNGWRLPSKDDFEYLYKFIGNELTQEKNLQIFQNYYCGYKDDKGCFCLDAVTTFWSSSFQNSNNSLKIWYYYAIRPNSSGFIPKGTVIELTADGFFPRGPLKISTNKNFGFSVRLVKDIDK
jgi:uncharacterized protein (TIGR02145 family)